MDLENTTWKRRHENGVIFQYMDVARPFLRRLRRRVVLSKSMCRNTKYFSYQQSQTKDIADELRRMRTIFALLTEGESLVVDPKDGPEYGGAKGS